MDFPTEPFLVGNQLVDPNFHIPLGFKEPTEYGIFWKVDEASGLRYHWLTPDERQAQWWEQEASHHFGACPRSPVKDWLSILPPKYTQSLEGNEALRACCRQAKEHEIEAFYTSEAQKQRGEPDLYVLHCKCGRKHRRVCGGIVDTRPFWEIR